MSTLKIIIIPKAGGNKGHRRTENFTGEIGQARDGQLKTEIKHCVQMFQQCLESKIDARQARRCLCHMY